MLQEKITSTIRQTMPSVVSILLSEHLASITKQYHPASYPFFPAHQRQLQHELEDEHRGYAGGGSGFVVDASGLIVTNKHVINDPKLDYVVVTTDGRHFPATVISIDPLNDVALLKVDATDLVPVTFGDAAKLELGTCVLAIGNALGVFKNTVSLGIVSGLARSVSTQADEKGSTHELRGLIQTDAAINPGNSGGPLVTLDGSVVGINAALINGAQNISLAIPVSTVIRDLEDLKKFGHIRRPYLGMRYVIVGEGFAKQLGAPVTSGAYVTGETPEDHGVVSGSPAAKAGLVDGDLVTTCDGRLLCDEYTFQDVLESAQVGQTIELSVWRGNKSHLVFVTLEERT